jgi:hypothetical protein
MVKRVAAAFTQNFKTDIMYVEFANILPKRTLLYLRLTSIKDSFTKRHQLLIISQVSVKSRKGKVTEMGNEKYMYSCSVQTEMEEATWWIDSCGCTWEIGSVLDLTLGNWNKCDCVGSNYGLLMRSCEKIIVNNLWFLKAEIFSCNIKKMVYHITYIVTCTRWRSCLRH